jgi:hypothetical protein
MDIQHSQYLKKNQITIMLYYYKYGALVHFMHTLYRTISYKLHTAHVEMLKKIRPWIRQAY